MAGQQAQWRLVELGVVVWAVVLRCCTRPTWAWRCSATQLPLELLCWLYLHTLVALLHGGVPLRS